MNLVIVFGILSWMLAASIGALLITIARIAFGLLPYTEGKYVLVLAALGIVATIEAFGFTARRGIMVLVVVLSFQAHSSPTHAGRYLGAGENALAQASITVSAGVTSYPGSGLNPEPFSL
jgi:hypothetical protein